MREAVRKATEYADSLQCFFLLHSLGGGTGSGLGTYILGQLAEDFPTCLRFTASVFPSEDDGNNDKKMRKREMGIHERDRMSTCRLNNYQIKPPFRFPFPLPLFCHFVLRASCLCCSASPYLCVYPASNSSSSLIRRDYVAIQCRSGLHGTSGARRCGTRHTQTHFFD